MEKQYVCVLVELALHSCVLSLEQRPTTDYSAGSLVFRSGHVPHFATISCSTKGISWAGAKVLQVR